MPSPTKAAPPPPAKVKWETPRGKILKSENITVVPFEEGAAGWYCVVIASTHPKYPVGGYHIFVSGAELEAAKELPCPK